MACFFAESAAGQNGGPGSSWTSGVNFGTNSPSAEDTWAFDAAEMPNGDLVIVGYAETGDGDVRVPAFAVLNKYGELLTSQYITGYPGVFSQVDLSDDGTYLILAGFRGLPDDDDPGDSESPENADALLTRLNFIGQGYYVDWSQQYAVGKTTEVPDGNGGNFPFVTGQERFTSVDITPTGTVVLNGGLRKGNSANPEFGYQFIYVVTSDGDFVSERIFTETNGFLSDCKVVNINGVESIIFTGFQQMGNGAWKFEITDNTPNSDNKPFINSKHPICDRDIVIGKLALNDLQNGFIKYYNGNSYPYSNYAYDDPQNPGAPTYINPHTGIWDAPDIDECPDKFGPCTPGKSVPGWGFAADGSKSGSPAIDKYLGITSCDIGKSIVYKDGYIYVAAEVNMLEFSGSQYNNLQFSEPHPGAEIPGKGVLLKDRCDGDNWWYSAYKDASIHIIRVKADGTGGAFVKNVAHFSGGDFAPALIVDQTDGNLVLGGNSGDDGVGACFPEMDNCHGEENMLIKLDINTLDVIWQQSHLAYGHGNCVFGLIQTADGGYVLVGNNELEGDHETFNIIRFTPDCQGKANFHQDGDYLVTSADEQWSPANKPNPYRFRGNVIVPNGKKLTIKDGLVVEFASTKATPDHRKSGITVQAGGNLDVLGASVLKGIDCGGENMWDGITVLGNPNAPAGPQQGRVSVTGLSRIENAVRGVVLGNTAWATETRYLNDGNTLGTNIADTYMDNLGMGGGRIFAGNATFYNCGRGVVWEPQPAFSNLSTLINAKFEFTGGLADPMYAFMPDWPSSGRPTGAELGCRLRSVRDVRFINCSFVATAPVGFYPLQRNRPSGIYATDAKFSFSGGGFPQHFENLYIGTESASMLAGLATTLSFSGAKMNNVYQGLNVRGNIAPNIAGCHYTNIPEEGQLKDGTPVGVFTLNTQGIALSGNEFSSDADYKSFGAITQNTLGTGGAKVAHNTFTDMNIANLFDGDNSALQTHCNTYQGDVGDVSWNVKGVLANQGNPLNPLTPKPDNKFLWDCGAPLLDISNGNSQPFSYFERLESPSNTSSIVKCTENVVVFFDNSDAGAANCVIEDPCPNPPNCYTLATAYTNSGHALPYRNDLLNAYVRMQPTAVPDSLSLPGTTRGIDLLLTRGQQEDKRILVATYTSLGNFSAAQQYLQQVSGASAETQDFIAYYAVLVNAGLAGRDAYHLTSSEFAQLAPLMANSSTVADQVKVLDHVLNGVYHPLSAESENSGRTGNREGDASSLSQSKKLLVFPNPFSEALRFAAPEGLSISMLTITDISGKHLYEQRFRKSESLVNWQPNDVPAGILLYRCVLSDGESVHGKLLYTKNQ